MGDAADKGSKTPGRRQLRVAEIIRHRLAELLCCFPLQGAVGQVEAIVTVTAVDMSPDLKRARVYVRVFKTATLPKNWLGQLCQARGSVRHMLGRGLDLKFTPELHFHEDESFTYADRIESLIAADRRDSS